MGLGGVQGTGNRVQGEGSGVRAISASARGGAGKHELPLLLTPAESGSFEIQDSVLKYGPLRKLTPAEIYWINNNNQIRSQLIAIEKQAKAAGKKAAFLAFDTNEKALKFIKEHQKEIAIGTIFVVAAGVTILAITFPPSLAVSVPTSGKLLVIAGGTLAAAACQAQNPTTPKDSGIIWGKIGGGGGNSSNKSSRSNSTPKPIVSPSPTPSVTPAPIKSTAPGATPSIRPTEGAIPAKADKNELPQQSPRPTTLPTSIPSAAPSQTPSSQSTSAPIFTPMPTGSPTSQPTARPTPLPPAVDQSEVESDAALFVLSKIKSLILLDKFEEAKAESKNALSQNYSSNLKKQILAQYLDALSKTDAGLENAYAIISSWENKSKANPNLSVSIQLGQENFQGIGTLKLSSDGYLSSSEDEAVFSIWLNIKFEYYTRNGMSDQAAELALIYLGL